MVCTLLAAQLKAVGYDARIVHLSELILPYLGIDAHWSNEYERIERLMTEGTKLRRSTEMADIVGRLGLAQIREYRKELTGDPQTPPASGVAYIIRSFKRPEEVSLYRDVYGKAFNLISVYSPKAQRIEHLTRRLDGVAVPGVESQEELSTRLVNRDQNETGLLGQQLGKTFPLADFFVSNASVNIIERQLRRFIHLVFGDPYISPTKEEQGMFFAQAAALRSLDLSRQVGAAITNVDGDVIATGCNEVAKAGGGLYWADDSPVARDFELGRDSNAKIKEELIEDVVRRLRRNSWLPKTAEGSSDAELVQEFLYGETAFLRESKIFDVIEFGRAVHAEMAAITQASRLGTSIRSARLFCTTFPCHICARHIIASGIEEVQFIEPYEKSRAKELFSDSLSVEPRDGVVGRTVFKAFVGVAPRRYMDLFTLSGDRKRDDGTILQPEDIAKKPKVRRIILAYHLAETVMIDQIPDTRNIKGFKNGSAQR